MKAVSAVAGVRQRKSSSGKQAPAGSLSVVTHKGIPWSSPPKVRELRKSMPTSHSYLLQTWMSGIILREMQQEPSVSGLGMIRRGAGKGLELKEARNGT